MEKPTHILPIPVQRALKKLGANIQEARKKRRIPTTLLSERASISRTTLTKIEKGDGSVSIELYAKVLFVLGMENRLADLIDPSKDVQGLHLEEERLPQRIRMSKTYSHIEKRRKQNE